MSATPSEGNPTAKEGSESPIALANKSGYYYAHKQVMLSSVHVHVHGDAFPQCCVWVVLCSASNKRNGTRAGIIRGQDPRRRADHLQPQASG